MTDLVSLEKWFALDSRSFSTRLAEPFDALHYQKAVVLDSSFFRDLNLGFRCFAFGRRPR